MKTDAEVEEKRLIAEKIRNLQVQILCVVKEGKTDEFEKKVRQVQRAYQLMERI